MNAASSVLGSVLAMVIAIHFGLNVTLGLRGAAYAAGPGPASDLAPSPRLTREVGLRSAMISENLPPFAER